jgi:site-specific DNA-methyltransferase (adenine-specific)
MDTASTTLGIHERRDGRVPCSVWLGELELRRANCMEMMRETPDKTYGLAICDPPYGIGRDGQEKTNTVNPIHRRKEWKRKGWDDAAPDAEYFAELRRVSEHQIIWGANYMTPHLPPSMGWIYWDKGQKLSMSDGELAYGSQQRALRSVTFNRCEAREDGLIHPTQKPVALYRWLLANYATKGQRILDTHMGSGSCAIACYWEGFAFTGCEIDQEYYDQAIERIKRETSQTRLFS